MTSMNLISSSDEEIESCSDVNVSDSEIVPITPPTILIPIDDVVLQCNWFQFV